MHDLQRWLQRCQGLIAGFCAGGGLHLSRKPLSHTEARMGFLAKALLVLLVLAIAGLIYVAKLAVLYIGPDILNFGWRLFRQGIRRKPFSQASPTDHSHAFGSQDPSGSAGSPSAPTYRSGTSDSLSQSRQEEKCCSLQVLLLSRVPLEVFSLVGIVVCTCLTECMFASK